MDPSFPSCSQPKSAPSDYLLFGPVKDTSRASHFADNKELKKVFFVMFVFVTIFFLLISADHFCRD
jgi:hypothetical protein